MDINVVNGNSKSNTPEQTYSFKTKDNQGNFKRFNKSRAIGMLIFYLLDKNITTRKDLLWLIFKYDDENAKDNIKLIESLERG